MKKIHVEELWRPAKGWEDVYHVSNLGRVKRVKKGIRGGKIGYILKHIPHEKGYVSVHLRDDGRTKTPLVHVLVAAAFLGDKPEGFEVNHKNGKRSECQLSNLEYMTPSKNKLHSYRVLKRAKVSNKGEAAGRAKLSNKQILEIRERYSQGGVTQQSLADEFGVNQTMIGFIVRRENWSHI